MHSDFSPDDVHSPDVDRSPGDPLDGLLARARWDAPSPESLPRLRRSFREAAGKHAAGRRRTWASISLAAALLLIATVSLLPSIRDRVALREARPAAGDGRDPRPGIDGRNVANPSTPSPEVDLPHAPLSTSPKPQSPAPAAPTVTDRAPTARAAAPEIAAPVRAPNMYERLVVASIERHSASKPTPPTAAPTGRANERPAIDPGPSPVDEAVTRLASNEEQGVSDEEFALLIATLTTEREHNQQRLLARLADSAATDRPAAARLLAEIGTPASLDTLRRLFVAPDTRPAAAYGLARLEDSPRLVALIQSESDTAIRGMLLSGLVERDDPLAVAALLEQIADPSRAEAALAALSTARRPPIDRLFGVLMGPRIDRRALAGRALGRIDGPIVTSRLVALVLQGAYQHDAMLALVGSRGSDAERFIDLARHDETLMASVVWAERQFAVLFPQQHKRFIP
jgi:hypothetical protein